MLSSHLEGAGEISRLTTFKLEQLQKLFHGHACIAYQSPECPDGKFLVLWNGEIDANAGFYHHQMASHLTHGFLTRFLKSLDCLLAGDIG